MRLLGVLLACLGVLALDPAAAQDTGDAGPGRGLLNAVTFKPLAAGSAIAVRPLDDSDDNLVLQREFERELRAMGYTVSANAALILSFDTRGTVGAWVSRERRTVLELEGHGGQEGGENAKLRLNLYNSSRGGVFNRGEGATTMIVTPSKYRLDATIDNRDDGKRLWQAWATAALGQSDGLSLTRAMVPVMVESLGHTVKRQPFDIR